MKRKMIDLFDHVFDISLSSLKLVFPVFAKATETLGLVKNEENKDQEQEKGPHL